MAILQRYFQKIFGSNTTELGQFGSAKDNTKVKSNNVETLQDLPAYENGWSDAIVTNKNYPTWQETNGILYGLSYQLAYIFQNGIPEYNAETEYKTGSIVKKVGTTELYTSLQDNNIGKDLSNPLYWKNTSLGSGGVPVGMIYPAICTDDYVPDGALPCDGSEYSKSQFNDLWTNYLTATTPLLNTCTYTEYQNDISTYGSCAKFGIDTVNNKFKVPTIKDGQYITQALSDTELGKSYNESVPNITGTIWGEAPSQEGKWSRVTGAFYKTNTSGQSGISAGDDRDNTDIGFDASRSSSIYQDNAPVQGNNVRLRYFVQVATGQFNDSQMDWSAWASSLTNKVDKSTLVETRVIIETSDPSILPRWYRIYSDGWCEQGGITTGTGTTVTLLKSFADTNYIILFDPYNGEAGSGALSDRKTVTNITTNSFYFGYTSGDVRPSLCSWITKGYLAEGQY